MACVCVGVCMYTGVYGNRAVRHRHTPKWLLGRCQIRSTAPLHTNEVSNWFNWFKNKPCSNPAANTRINPARFFVVCPSYFQTHFTDRWSDWLWCGVTAVTGEIGDDETNYTLQSYCFRIRLGGQGVTWKSPGRLTAVAIAINHDKDKRF